MHRRWPVAGCSSSSRSACSHSRCWPSNSATARFSAAPKRAGSQEHDRDHGTEHRERHGGQEDRGAVLDGREAQRPERQEHPDRRGDSRTQLAQDRTQAQADRPLRPEQEQEHEHQHEYELEHACQRRAW